MTKKARILLADDHTLILEGFQTVLAPHHEIVGAVTDGRTLLEAAGRLKPDLIILDITMPLLNGVDAARQIRKSLPQTKLLFVTMHVNPTYLQAALKVGGTGYVLKSSAREEILAAVEKVLEGRVYVTPGLGGDALTQFPNPSAKNVEKSFHLTAREREVLQLIAEGRAGKEVAQMLNITIKTVAFHRKNIKNKLGLHSTAELTKYAIEEGLI